MNDTSRLVAIEDIRKLKARYFRCMDTKDWFGLKAVLATDVITDFRESTGETDESMLHHGAADYVAMLSAVLEKVVTVHHGHMAEIQIESEFEASGVWAMEDKLWPQANSVLPFAMMHGYGHYHERYVKRERGWQIQEIRLSRLRVDVQ